MPNNLRILVIADGYGEISSSPRIRFFCKYWSQKGYEIEVFCEKGKGIDFEHTYPIVEVPIYKTKSGIEWAFKSLLNLLFDYKERRFYKKVREAVANKQYNAVFCMTFSTFPLKTAYLIAKEKNIPFFADIRDLVEQFDALYWQVQVHQSRLLRPVGNLFTKINVRRRNAILPHATHIFTVSPWHADFLKQFNPNVSLIYNGYDSDQFFFEAVKSDKFMISYIGKRYDYQDDSLLYEALKQLDLPDVEVHFYPSQQHALIPIEQVGDAIRKSSIILVLTSPMVKGVLGTKFYEGLGCEKPILCTQSDEGLLAQTIRELNAGIASSNLEEIKNFILDKYNEWKTNGFTHQNVVEQRKNFFSRQHQTQTMDEIMLSKL